MTDRAALKLAPMGTEPGHDDVSGPRGRGLLVQILVQIAPFGIALDDQAGLPGAGIMLDVFLALDRGANVLEEFYVHEEFQSVALGEALGQALAMFPGAAGNVGGDAGVEDSVRAVGHDVDPAAGHGAQLPISS